MHNTSATYNALWAGSHRVETRVKIDRGEGYPEGYWVLLSNVPEPILTDDSENITMDPFPDVDLRERKLLSVTTTGGMYANEYFGIGGCVSREVEVKFLLDGATIPRNAKIQPEIRLVGDDGTVSEWVPKGAYWIDTREYDQASDVMTIRGYDAMLKAEANYIAGDVGLWPQTMADVAEEIAGLIGVEIDSRTVMDSSYEMQLPTGYSMREVLGYIAAANAGNWVITDEGTLRLIRVTDHVYGTRLGPAEKSFKQERAYGSFSKVEIDLSDDSYVEAGDTTGRSLRTVIPVVTTSQAQTIAEDILDALDDFLYYPYSAEGAILNPAYEIGDFVEVSFGSVYIIANQTMYLDSLCASDISAPSEDELEHEYPYESVKEREVKRSISKVNTRLTVAVDGITGRVEDLEEDYAEISVKLDNITLTVSTTDGIASISLSVDGTTQSGTIDLTGYVTITNLATSGSTTINGDNITTGTISANRIDTSSLRVREIYAPTAYEDTDALVFTSVAKGSRVADIFIGFDPDTASPASAQNRSDVSIYGRTIELAYGSASGKSIVFNSNTGIVTSTWNSATEDGVALGAEDFPFYNVWSTRYTFWNTLSQHSGSYLIYVSGHLRFYAPDGTFTNLT